MLLHLACNPLLFSLGLAHNNSLPVEICKLQQIWIALASNSSRKGCHHNRICPKIQTVAHKADGDSISSRTTSRLCIRAPGLTTTNKPSSHPDQTNNITKRARTSTNKEIIRRAIISRHFLSSSRAILRSSKLLFPNRIKAPHKATFST